MFRTTDLDSTIFRHLTGKDKPALVHPTNTAFDPEGWKSVIDAIGNEPMSPRDMLLMQVAMLIGIQNAILRHLYTNTLFTGFSPDQVLTLALANANRGYLVIKFKADEAAAAAFEAAGGRPLDFGAISQLLIEPAPGQSPATADDLNNSLIDTLPHWFALARDIPEGSRMPGEDLGGVAQRAGACLSLEHAFRSIWQEALWEPWRFGQGADGYVMVPADADWMAGWRVWDLREQSLHLQGAMLNRQLEKRIPNAYLTRSLPRTVTAIDLDTVPPTLTVEAPSEEQAAAHRMSIDAVSDAYTFVFADQVVGAPGVTVALLSEAGVGDQAPDWQLTFAPPSEAAAGDLSAATAQGGTVNGWLAVIDPQTGLLLPEPIQVFAGELDYARLRVGKASRTVEWRCASALEPFHDQEIGARLSDSWHKTVWPGETGLANMTGIEKTSYWGVESPPSGVTTGSGGGAGLTNYVLRQLQ